MEDAGGIARQSKRNALKKRERERFPFMDDLESKEPKNEYIGKSEEEQLEIAIAMPKAMERAKGKAYVGMETPNNKSFYVHFDFLGCGSVMPQIMFQDAFGVTFWLQSGLCY